MKRNRMLEQSTRKSWKELIEQFEETFDVEIFMGFPNQEVENGTYGHKKNMVNTKPLHPKMNKTFNSTFLLREIYL